MDMDPNPSEAPAGGDTQAIKSLIQGIHLGREL